MIIYILLNFEKTFVSTQNTVKELYTANFEVIVVRKGL